MWYKSLSVIFFFPILVIAMIKKIVRGSHPPSEKFIVDRVPESLLWKQGYECLIGADEVGRGCLAGPVVAAAVYVPSTIKDMIPHVADSKKISSKAREKIYDCIMENDLIIKAHSIVESTKVDEMNILQATMLAISSSVSQVVQSLRNRDVLATQTSTCAMIDGNMCPPSLKHLGIDCKHFVKGDSYVYSIALASIIAKVERDRIMSGYDICFPLYGLARHKGYPTKMHIESIRQFGPTPIHRLSFSPLKETVKGKTSVLEASLMSEPVKLTENTGKKEA